MKERGSFKSIYLFRKNLHLKIIILLECFAISLKWLAMFPSLDWSPSPFLPNRHTLLRVIYIYFFLCRKDATRWQTPPRLIKILIHGWRATRQQSVKGRQALHQCSETLLLFYCMQMCHFLLLSPLFIHFLFISLLFWNPLFNLALMAKRERESQVTVITCVDHEATPRGVAILSEARGTNCSEVYWVIYYPLTFNCISLAAKLGNPHKRKQPAPGNRLLLLKNDILLKSKSKLQSLNEPRLIKS